MDFWWLYCAIVSLDIFGKFFFFRYAEDNKMNEGTRFIEFYRILCNRIKAMENFLNQIHILDTWKYGIDRYEFYWGVFIKVWRRKEEWEFSVSKFVHGVPDKIFASTIEVPMLGTNSRFQGRWIFHSEKTRNSKNFRNLILFNALWHIINSFWSI